MMLKHNLADHRFPSFLSEVTPEELRRIAHAKRFVERYCGDAAFRAAVAEDAAGAAARYGLEADPAEIRALWDPAAARREIESGASPSPTVELCLRYDRAMVAWMMRRRGSESLVHPNFRAWWDRQLARTDSELGAPFNLKDVHAPVSFELSQGCTVGCWFCGISSERFAGALPYTPENARLWRGVLEVVRDLVGPAAEVGFCYWATDPMDTPDYEAFLHDYYAIIGALPPTTTAQPQKHVERLRALLRMWEEHSFVYNRFSILSTRILDVVHREFTAEELVWTGLEMLNKESTKKKATAGRALERLERQRDRVDHDESVADELTQGTIACVTGFLFNLVTRTVQLVSPCRADDRWPKGYRVYEECRFADAVELRAIMEGMIERYMPLHLRGTDRVRLRPDLRVQRLPDGCRLATPFLSRDLRHPRYGRVLADLLVEGTHTVDDLVARLAGLGAAPSEVSIPLDVLFQGGLLDTETAPA